MAITPLTGSDWHAEPDRLLLYREVPHLPCTTPQAGKMKKIVGWTSVIDSILVFYSSIYAIRSSLIYSEIAGKARILLGRLRFCGYHCISVPLHRIFLGLTQYLDYCKRLLVSSQKWRVPRQASTICKGPRERVWGTVSLISMLTDWLAITR